MRFTSRNGDEANRPCSTSESWFKIRSFCQYPANWGFWRCFDHSYRWKPVEEDTVINRSTVRWPLNYSTVTPLEHGMLLFNIIPAPAAYPRCPRLSGANTQNSTNSCPRKSTILCDLDRSTIMHDSTPLKGFGWVWESRLMNSCL